MNLYKLNSNVEIKEIAGNIYFCPDKKNVTNAEIITPDPRNENWGLRIIIPHPTPLTNAEKDMAQYHKFRINHKIIEGAYDLTPEKSLILEFGYQNLNAISFTKGCYIGQELTTRTYRTGVIRKAIYGFTIEKDLIFTKNDEVLFEDKKLGIICSSHQESNKITGLGLFRIEKLEGKKTINITINSQQMTIEIF